MFFHKIFTLIFFAAISAKTLAPFDINNFQCSGISGAVRYILGIERGENFFLRGIAYSGSIDIFRDYGSATYENISDDIIIFSLEGQKKWKLRTDIKNAEAILFDETKTPKEYVSLRCY